MKYYIVDLNTQKPFYVYGEDNDAALGKAFSKLKHTNFSITESILPSHDFPIVTNIYLATIDNGMSYDDRSDLSIVVHGKNKKEAEILAMQKFNSKRFGNKLGDGYIGMGGTLTLNLYYKGVILKSKKN